MAQCCSCGSDVRGEGPDSRCHNCRAALWRPPTSDELAYVPELTHRIEECLPAAGRRPLEQIDGVVDAHLPDDRQAAARELLHRALRVLPLRAGERAVWAGEVWRGDFGEIVGPSGGTWQIQCSHVLVTSERFMLVSPAAGRSRKPTVNVLTIKDLSWGIYVATTMPDAEPFSPDRDRRSSQVMLTLADGRKSYRWHTRIALGESDAPWVPAQYQGVSAAVDVAKRVAVGELQAAGAKAVIIDGFASETAMAGWLAEHGINVNATGSTRDRGVDLRGPGHVGQVRMTSAKIGPTPVQAIVGVGCVEKRRPLFFSKAGYTPTALDWAEQAKLPLFTFTDGGQVRAANRFAEEVVAAVPVSQADVVSAPDGEGGQGALPI